MTEEKMFELVAEEMAERIQSGSYYGLFESISWSGIESWEFLQEQHAEADSTTEYGDFELDWDECFQEAEDILSCILDDCEVSLVQLAIEAGVISTNFKKYYNDLSELANIDLDNILYDRSYRVNNSDYSAEDEKIVRDTIEFIDEHYGPSSLEFYKFFIELEGYLKGKHSWVAEQYMEFVSAALTN